MDKATVFTATKDLVDIASKLLGGAGIFVTAVAAFVRWARPPLPNMIIREIVFIPPNTHHDIKSNEIVIGADVIFANTGSISVLISEVSLEISDGNGGNYSFSPFIYAKPGAFFDEKTPEWIEELFHPVHVRGTDEKQGVQEIGKCILFFQDQNKRPDGSRRTFTPVQGECQLKFTLRRNSYLPWRRKVSIVKVFDMDAGTVESLTSKTNPGKVGLLAWHLREKKKH